LAEWANKATSIAPGVFIFHISRCGSTLVSQLFAALNRCISLSEVPFFDDLLRLPFQDPDFDESLTGELLTSAITFYGQRRTGNEQHLVIKADSWHIGFYEKIRSLYPEVPFVLMYRRPDEVFRSHRKLKGMQAVPGLIEPQVFGFDPSAIDYCDFDRYLSGVLEGYLTKYLEIIETDKHSLLVNYNEGAMPIIKKITSFAGISLSDDEIGLMQERSRYHSKTPGERFSEETRAESPACLATAMALYEKLEERRASIN
jgi:hypothetical protein